MAFLNNCNHKKTVKHLTFLCVLRDGNHKSVLALIPGTMEQLQAEVYTLKESMRNMQTDQGGARINVPECPVII